MNYFDIGHSRDARPIALWVATRDGRVHVLKRMSTENHSSVFSGMDYVAWGRVDEYLNSGSIQFLPNLSVWAQREVYSQLMSRFPDVKFQVFAHRHDTPQHAHTYFTEAGGEDIAFFLIEGELLYTPNGMLHDQFLTSYYELSYDFAERLRFAFPRGRASKFSDGRAWCEMSPELKPYKEEIARRLRLGSKTQWIFDDNHYLVMPPDVIAKQLIQEYEDMQLSMGTQRLRNALKSLRDFVYDNLPQVHKILSDQGFFKANNIADSRVDEIIQNLIESL